MHYTVTEYSCCEHGNPVKTESRAEGGEDAGGVSVAEKVRGDKGSIVREFSYNTLDSGTKFYTESGYAEDDKNHNLNCVTYLTSGKNVVQWEYDHECRGALLTGLVCTPAVPSATRG